MTSRRKDCDEMHVLLHQRLDGELGGKEQAALDLHLESCPSCRRELEQLSEVVSLVQAIGELPRQDTPVAPHRTRSMSIPLHASVSALAALILLSVTLFLVTPTDDPPTQTPELTASLKLSDSDSDLLTVHLPSQDPEVHVFWVYGTIVKGQN